MSDKLRERIRAREQAKIRPAPEKPKKTAKRREPAVEETAPVGTSEVSPEESVG